MTPLAPYRSESAVSAGCDTYVKRLPDEPAGVLAASPPAEVRVGVSRYEGDNPTSYLSSPPG